MILFLRCRLRYNVDAVPDLGSSSVPMGSATSRIRHDFKDFDAIVSHISHIIGRLPIMRRLMCYCAAQNAFR